MATQLKQVRAVSRKLSRQVATDCELNGLAHKPGQV